MVDTMLMAAASSRQKSAESEAKIKAQHLSMVLGKMNVEMLEDFLQKYAPLQLVFDRKSHHKKLHLSRKTLTACSFVHAASVLVKRAEETCGESKTTQLEQLGILLANDDKRVALPHQMWTGKQDAVLINAIAKHGWLESEISVKKIANDPATKWGFPFDKEDIDTPVEAANSAPLSRKEVMICSLKNAASRAAKFLNVHEDLLDELSSAKASIDIDQVIRNYCLEREVDDEESMEVAQINENVTEGFSTRKEWVVDEESLIRSTGLSGTDSEAEELPPRKVLVKRAKMLLNRVASLPSAGTSTSTFSVANSAKSSSQNRFAVLDQREKMNFLLAELFRLIIKAPQKKFGKQIRLLISSAAEEAGKLHESLEQLKAESARDLEETVKHLALVKTTFQTSTTKAKNVLRAMLGINLHGEYPYFPGERSANSFASNQIILGTKTKKELNSSAEIALTKGISRAQENSSGAHAKPAAEDTLTLTGIETIILNVLSSAGIPVFNGEWESTFHCEGSNDEAVKFKLLWSGLVSVLESAARMWHQTAKDKLEKTQKDCAKLDNANEPNAKDLAAKRLQMAVRDEHSKEIAAGQASDFSLNSKNFAKKAIMLLERLRLHGNASGKAAKGKKKNVGLGPRIIPSWFSNQLSSWAEKLDIRDANGKNVLSYTAIDFYEELPSNEKELVDICCLLKPADCRQVLTQCAQLSRARAFFLSHPRKNTFIPKFEKAEKNARAGDEWKNRPAFWGVVDGATSYSVCHDILLLESLCEHGFGNVLMARGFGSSSSDHELTLKELGVSKSALQIRANQLTRELHALEETAVLIETIGERKALTESKSRENSMSGVSVGAKKQTLHSFFSKSQKSQHGKKTKVVSDVIVLSDTEIDDDQKKQVKENAQKNGTKASVIVVDIDDDDDDNKDEAKGVVGNAAATATTSPGTKRTQNCANDGGSSSPEKKLRVA